MFSLDSAYTPRLFWQGTPIHLHLVLGACLAPLVWHHPVYFLPSSNWWRNWTGQSGAQNLSKAVHLEQTWRMVILVTDGRICPQFHCPLSDSEISILPHDVLWTPCLLPSQKDLPTKPRKETLWSVLHSWWCQSCPQGGSAENEGADLIQVHSMEDWQQGMAGNDKPSYGKTQETLTEVHWAIWSWGSDLPHCILPPHSFQVEDPPCLPCLSPHHI